MIGFLFSLFVVAPLGLATTIIPFLMDCAMARLNWFKELAAKVKPSTPALSDPANLRLSVIIPAFREADTVLKTLRHAKATLQSEHRIEFIVSVVDDATADQLRECEIPIAVVRSQAGRSAALNAGAGKAVGDVLLFLHADCKLPRYWDMEVRAAVCREGVVGGAFSFELDLPSSPRALALRALVATTNARSSLLQLPYGDQAIFVTKQRFQSMGGFPDMPLMEDYEFIRRLRRAALHSTIMEGVRSRVVTLPAAVKCSARRWQGKGVLATTVTNQVIVGLYVFGGFRATTLYQLYYGHRLPPVKS